MYKVLPLLSYALPVLQSYCISSAQVGIGWWSYSEVCFIGFLRRSSTCNDSECPESECLRFAPIKRWLQKPDGNDHRVESLVVVSVDSGDVSHVGKFVPTRPVKSETDVK